MRERERERELNPEPEAYLLTLPGVTAPNFANRTLWTADNLDVMRGMNSETVDLIYLDPPFNSKRDYAAPIGSQAAGAAFTDTWSLDDIKQEHAEELQASAPELWHTVVGAGHTAGDSMQAYLTYMSIRLVEMHRILKQTGSIYLHCDPTASHYLKQLMDAVFGRGNFRNEVVWCYSSGGASKKYFARKHDVLLVYGRGIHPTHNVIRVPYATPDVEGRAGFHPDGKMLQDWWSDIGIISTTASERTGYPTQKPLALLERVLMASSNPGDVVFDPFCGCATTMVAAEKLGRQWIGCDIEPLARDLVVERLQKNADQMPLFKLNLGGTPELPEIIHATTPPNRTDPEAPRRSKNIKDILYRQQNGCCVGKCGGRDFPIDIFEIDHIVPRSKGGADVDSNLQLLCPTCNGSKSNRAMSKWLAGK